VPPTASESETTCIVIGAGPAGLAAAACLRRERVPFRLLDRAGVAGGAYREIYGRITLASPAVLDSLPGMPLQANGEYVTAGEYREYLRRYAEHVGAEIEAAEVREVRRDDERGGGFVVDAGDRVWRARFVVVATGMWSHPVTPRVRGLDGCGVPFKHARDWRGPDAATRGPLLIVGAATSAVEIAEEAATAGVPVTLAVRSRLHVARQTFLGRDVHHWVGPVAGLPSWVAPGHCANRPTLPGTDRGFSRLRAAGRISVRPALLRLEPGGLAHFADGHAARFAEIVAATGYAFATPFLPATVARAPAGHLLAHHTESVSWPGLFTVGSPCAARLDSEFLRGMPRDAATAARAISARAIRS
jgi:putative flavoprotein involved in K+ transport